MTIQQEEELRNLCRRAVHEKDVGTLLKVYLRLDQAAEAEQRDRTRNEQSKP
jgi:hypothetical protein